jgi:serine phosphatase RsbU (regulator of sigma subunit)
MLHEEAGAARAPAVDQRAPGEMQGVSLTSAAARELQSTQWSMLVAGQSMLFVAEVVAVLLRLSRVEEALPPEIAVSILIVANVAILLALIRLPASSGRALLYLSVDIATVGLVAGMTDGLRSPFAGLFFLVTLVGSVYFGLAGGILVAAAGSAILVISSALRPEIWADVMRDHARTQTIPLLLLQGGIAGYLVQQMRHLHQRRLETEEQLRRAEVDRALRQQEAAVAREIQLAALTEPPQHPNWEISAFFEPAREVGGDFYAFLPEGERLGVIIGDVSGKGVPAALVSTSICHLIRCLRPMEDPARFLASVNENLLEKLPEWAFATMAFAMLDAQRESLAVYRAGHPPPLVLRPGGTQRVEKPNVPLGLVDEAGFMPTIIPFRAGDTLVLYSDALIDVRNPEGETLDLEGLERIVGRHAGLSPGELLTAIVQDAKAYGDVQDDLTLLVVRPRP